MKITSSEFEDGATIPSVHTCEGKHLSPPLAFQNVPKEAKSLVLIMDDPDVPPSVRSDRMFDHWVLFNIPPATHSIPAGGSAGTHGCNTLKENRYYGPCPPDREHRYFFKLYALDTMLNLSTGASKKEVERAMQGHIIAEAKLMGRYEKNKS